MRLSRKMFYPMDQASEGSVAPSKTQLSPQIENPPSINQEQMEETQP
jgi:hypothetical protein